MRYVRRSSINNFIGVLWGWTPTVHTAYRKHFCGLFLLKWSIHIPLRSKPDFRYIGYLTCSLVARLHSCWTRDRVAPPRATSRRRVRTRSHVLASVTEYLRLGVSRSSASTNTHYTAYLAPYSKLCSNTLCIARRQQVSIHSLTTSARFNP